MHVKTSTFKYALLGYWLLVPALFYCYLFLMSGNQSIAVTDLLIHIPSLTLASLIACLLLFQGAMFYFIQRTFKSCDGLLGQFLTAMLPQQIVTGNLIGAALIFFTRRALPKTKEQSPQGEKLIVYLAISFIYLLTAISLFLLWRTNQ